MEQLISSINDPINGIVWGWPMVLLIAFTGIVLMLGFGVLGFLMEENEIPIAPCILGIVIGPILERNFITTMIKSDGAVTAFFERPIAAALGAVVVIIWLSLILGAWRRRSADDQTS